LTYRSEVKGLVLMLTSFEREVLRRQAMTAWEHAKRLNAEATRVVAAAAQTVRSSGRKRQLPVTLARYRQGETFTYHAAADTESPRHPASRSELEMLVDRAILRFTPIQEDREALGLGAGLLASVDLEMLMRLSQLARRCLGYVVSAHDAGTALGLAMVTQPDIAIVDARLDLASAVDLAAALPLYAPRTRSLVLTDDRDLGTTAQLAGADVLSRQVSERELVSWVSKAAA
jgi:hypothetical protein